MYDDSGVYKIKGGDRSVEGIKWSDRIESTLLSDTFSQHWMNFGCWALYIAF